jgi:hypothetical protein
LEDAHAREIPLFPLDDPRAEQFNFWNVWAVMVAHNDPSIQRAIKARATIKLLARTANPATQLIEVSRNAVMALADDAAMSRLYGGLEAIEGSKGCVAGFVLIYMHLMSLDPTGNASLNRALHYAAKQAQVAGRWGDGTMIPQTTRQLRKFWDERRDVSHLWAAQMLVDHRYSTPEGSNFSYGTHVVEMLEWADAFRRWLEGFTPLRATGPLVGTTDMWRTPSGYQLRHRSLPAEQSPMTDQMRAWAASYRAPTTKFFDY